MILLKIVLIITRMMFMVLSSCQAVAKLPLREFTRFIWWTYRLSAGSPPTLIPSQRTWTVNPPVACCHPHQPSPLIIITHPESWYSFYVSSRVEGWAHVGTAVRVCSPCSVAVVINTTSGQSMAALCNRAGHIYFHLVYGFFSFFLSFFFFPCLISAVGDSMSTILPHIVWL